jgi:dienelactone hydrolase
MNGHRVWAGIGGQLMRKRTLFLGLVTTIGIVAVIGWQFLPQPYIAQRHPIRYYLSLPAHWSQDRSWPILVIVDGVNQGHFLWNFLRFRQARHALPFILISPLVISNSGHPDSHDYSYSPDVWARVDRQGAVPFDAAGVLAIVDEVQQIYHGEHQFYLTGWSAGGHLAWYLIFTHPERLAGVVLAGANYAGRGVTAISTAPERASLPIRGIQGDHDSHLAALNGQWEQATALAAHQGYGNIARTIIPNASHDSFPDYVFTELNSMRTSNPNVRHYERRVNIHSISRHGDVSLTL